MLYIKFRNGLPVEICEEHPKGDKEWLHPSNWKRGEGWLCSRDFKTYDEVKRIAGYLTFMMGDTYLATDTGPGASPRYDIKKAPKVGDPVSKSFNGDYYPCGYITKITPSWQITTDTGQKFRRYRESGGWRETGRGFWMVAGHIDERNPHI